MFESMPGRKRMLWNLQKVCYN